MRTRSILSLFLVIPLLVAGSAVAVVATGDSPVATGDSPYALRTVGGALDVQPLPGGTFDVQDRVFRYREFPVSGAAILNDPRLNGDLTAEWNWDVYARGGQPIPSWGTITIEGDAGSWRGDFTGIRVGDFQPVSVRTMLIGEGAHDGLCATLDIAAGGMAQNATWTVNGVVHPIDIS
jgi:hypothetical protein